MNLSKASGGGDVRIRIAVLDGPVDTSHPCLQGAALTAVQTVAGKNAAGGRATAHGTHVASIIFGQPGSEVPGIAPGCSGLILPIFSDETPDRGLACSQLDLARAILMAVENGAHVINISGGQLTPSGEPEPILADAIASCRRHNVLIVAAAGNDGCECLHVPAAAPSVLVVGAMDEDGNPLEFEQLGRGLPHAGNPGTRTRCPRRGTRRDRTQQRHEFRGAHRIGPGRPSSESTTRARLGPRPPCRSGSPVGNRQAMRAGHRHRLPKISGRAAQF